MHEQVPSWQVTASMLESWGFPVQTTDKVVGTKVIVKEGLPFGKALFAAWAAGHVRIAAMPDHVREAQMAAGRERIAEMRRAAVENLAFLRAHGTIVGPSHNN
jgi:hypothetical protein